MLQRMKEYQPKTILELTGARNSLGIKKKSVMDSGAIYLSTNILFLITVLENLKFLSLISFFLSYHY